MGLMKLGLHKSWQLMLDHQHHLQLFAWFLQYLHFPNWKPYWNEWLHGTSKLSHPLLPPPPLNTASLPTLGYIQDTWSYECWDWRSSQTTNWHEMGVFRWIRSHLLSYWSIVLKTVLWLADLTSPPGPPTVPADTDLVADVWRRDHCNSCHCSPKKL